MHSLETQRSRRNGDPSEAIGRYPPLSRGSVLVRCIKYCFRRFLLVFCFFTDKALSWCEIRQVLRQCNSPLLFRRAPPLPRCLLPIFQLCLSLYSSLMFWCFSISILFACYLAASYYPSPHPIAIVCLPISLASRSACLVVCSSCWSMLVLGSGHMPYVG